MVAAEDSTENIYHEAENLMGKLVGKLYKQYICIDKLDSSSCSQGPTAGRLSYGHHNTSNSLAYYSCIQKRGYHEYTNIATVTIMRCISNR